MDGPIRRRRARPATYHHGDLRAALLGAAETILERDGIQALTLRAAARAAGVSHAAPAHHFDDLTGLLSELAAVGFVRFGVRVAAATAAAAGGPRSRLQAMGRAYVAFARAHPGLFQLMFRSERLDATRPALRDGLAAAGQALRRAVAARASRALSPGQVAAEAAAAWSLAHGFAVLLLDGRLRPLIAALPRGGSADALLEAVFAVTRVGRGTAPARPRR
ncbi:MAG TPA: TetR-like C-terminal domain-containing protein [Candidatus Sulfotelmatobacter sp.]|nr:TetR-like C-terminal domain-containing protein [Candidatus Sulfotelmatobacter sp.]